jgi:hypothetical protein
VIEEGKGIVPSVYDQAAKASVVVVDNGHAESPLKR